MVGAPILGLAAVGLLRSAVEMDSDDVQAGLLEDSIGGVKRR
jgi:hypothetical protein